MVKKVQLTDELKASLNISKLLQSVKQNKPDLQKQSSAERVHSFAAVGQET